MRPQLDEMLERFKQRYPRMDLEMIRFFSGTMIMIQEIGIMMESYFGRNGLSKARFAVMIHLHGSDDPAGVNISELLTFHDVSSATMTGIIDTLEREGLLERIPCPEDRRRVNLRITDAGRAFMDDFLPRHQAYIGEFSKNLNDRERQTLLKLIAKLHRGIADGVALDLPSPQGSTS